MTQYAILRLAWALLLTLNAHQGVSLTFAWGGKRSKQFGGRDLRSRGGSTSASARVPQRVGQGSTLTSDRRGGASLMTNSSTVYHDAGEIIGTLDPAQNRGPLKVLFLSADTGGGHRASAESLAKQFLVHYPGSTYDLLDVWTPCGVYPYRTLVDAYKHLSAHPNQWKVLYHVSNTLPWEAAVDVHTLVRCERGVRERIAAYDPDVIVSVHPAMNHVPLISTQKISKAKGKHIPFFTVVTDLGSAHCTWFQKHVDKLYVASERLYRLAKLRGRMPDENIVMSGLPIRHDFVEEFEKMGGDRTKPAGRLYQHRVREKILPQMPDLDQPVILLMGGGEGVGSLSDIVDELYTVFYHKGIDATICVVCGRNEKLQTSLVERDWKEVVEKLSVGDRNKRRKKRRRLFSRRPRLEAYPTSSKKGHVQVVGLGFVTNIAEYMVAADILVSKAGPGTIAEAAAVGLPVLMTSFLPGQEAGNVDVVIESGFGDYCDEPVYIADEVSTWLQRPDYLAEMSRNAQAVGHPDAAAEIVLDIGSITHTWMALNGNNGGAARN